MPKLAFYLLGAIACFSICSCCTRNFVYVKNQEPLRQGKTVNLTDEELAIEDQLKKTAAIPQSTEYFKQFFSSAYLIIEGFDSLCFTYLIKDDKGTLKRGLDHDIIPDLVIPMNKINCGNLLHIFEDSVVSDEEEYRIFCVTFIPTYSSTFLRRDELYNPELAKELALPNFMQIVLKNENHYIYQNTTEELSATIVNVDGQWLIFKGAVGDPDIRMEVTHKQAAEVARLIINPKAKGDESIAQKKEKIANIKKLMEAVIVYRRK